MRLTCPRCAAQYDIPDSVIPASGREVECSACSHVWHQDAPGRPQAVSNFEDASLSPQQYDASARPALNRPLHESVLAILREETARELAARSSKTQTKRTAMDADDGPAASTPLPGAALPRSDEIDWPVSTVILPGEPLPPEPEHTEPEPIEPAFPETEAAPASESSVEKTAPDEPQPETIESTVVQPTVAPNLPDAESLAATLTRRVPVPEIPLPVAEAQLPDPPVKPPEPAASAPVIAPRRNGGGYRLGFGLAVLIALAVLATYAIAPRTAPAENGGMMSEWRQSMDRGRIWLHDQAIAFKGLITRD
ncbi:zinc-ribbon domain-containing protein [Paracoccus aestuariivivens]|uniref:Zinc finger/thioredoxin putative domain-containing protein n=1 Tax=Paracoccus aestuariivivens TaxID=1820333 RepID=A0A6L6JGF0_9RHOB|nr:zinc-ribbon domain-containing protein [Paracoccus aestuariivivens]MTH78961.1 hypothetical protein [Paracoccus aestuariivivens]